MRISQSVINSFRGVSEKKVNAAEKCKPESFDKDSLTATFISTSTGAIYDVSLKSCTCVDFSIHHEPCKHMVRLAMLAGLPISFIHEIRVPVEVLYGDPVPESLDDIGREPPEVRDYTVSEFFQMLDSFGIAHEDNRQSGGCIWIENQKPYTDVLSKITVEGKNLKRKYLGSHFPWCFDWYLMSEVKKNG